MGRGYDHVPLCLQLNVRAYTDKMLVMRRPVKLAPTPKSTMTAAQRRRRDDDESALFSRLWSVVGKQFYDAIAADDIERAHCLWSDVCEQFLRHCSSDSLEADLPPTPNNTPPRSTMLPTMEVPLSQRVAEHYDRSSTVITEGRDRLHVRLRDLAARIRRWKRLASDDSDEPTADASVEVTICLESGRVKCADVQLWGPGLT